MFPTSDRAASALFFLLLSVEVIRQRSFWLTVLGDGPEQQFVAIGSAAAFSGCQLYLAHHSARGARAFLESPGTGRNRAAQLLILLPLIFAWFLQIVAVGTTAALDIAMRLGRHASPTAMLISTGLTDHGAGIVLAFSSILVTSALLAGLTAIGIRTADGEAERQTHANHEHELELQRVLSDRNRYQDLYNSLSPNPSLVGVGALPAVPESIGSTPEGPEKTPESIGSAPESIGSGPESNGSTPESPEESIGSTPESPDSDDSRLEERIPAAPEIVDDEPQEEDLLNLACPHCGWETGPRKKKSARLALNGHLGAKHRKSARQTQPEPQHESAPTDNPATTQEP